MREISDPGLKAKYDCLKAILGRLTSVAVAFSGGADSTLLLAAAHGALGDRVLAVTAQSSFTPRREMGEASGFCERNGIRHIVFDIDMHEICGFCENTEKRCYYCKKHMLSRIWQIARENDILNIAEGTNADDDLDIRPGAEAVKEQAAVSPLKLAGFTKADIRAVSEAMGLPTWDKPSAACLATRLPYGELITEEILGRIERAELVLSELGLRRIRVRYHGAVARIETDEAGYGLFADRSLRESVYAEFRKIGFTYSALDLIGYRTGSVNEAQAIAATHAEACV